MPIPDMEERCVQGKHSHLFFSKCSKSSMFNTLYTQIEYKQVL
jgi:hypothetical protein